MNNFKTLLIIPAYNEEKNIVSLLDKIIINFPQYDYIVINDCSGDKTEQICRENNYNYLTLPVNLGIGGAVQCGYRYALENDYDFAVQVDGDGQHDPVYILNLIEPLINGKFDMVIGSRFIDNRGFQSSAIRRLGINIIKIFIWLCSGCKTTDTTSGFRSVNRGLIKLFSAEYAHDYPEPEAIVTAVLRGFRVSEIPVIMKERAAGKSSIGTLRSIYYMFKVPLALIVYRLSIKNSKI